MPDQSYFQVFEKVVIYIYIITRYFFQEGIQPSDDTAIRLDIFFNISRLYFPGSTNNPFMSVSKSTRNKENVKHS